MSFQEIKSLEIKNLLEEVEVMQKEGYRLVQISCTTLEKYELTYSFSKQDITDFINLRVLVKGDEVIPSISGIYPYAFLYENELHDLFDLTIHGMNIDFKGQLYQTAVKTPFKA
jgi:ech hydrogenase subunit D